MTDSVLCRLLEGQNLASPSTRRALSAVWQRSLQYAQRVGRPSARRRAGIRGTAFPHGLAKALLDYRSNPKSWKPDDALVCQMASVIFDQEACTYSLPLKFKVVPRFWHSEH